MRTIYKYELVMADTQEFFMPKKAVILDVQFQNEKMCVWALIDTEDTLTTKRFTIIGTGNPISKDIFPGLYIGTVQTGAFVWHVFHKDV